MFTGKSIYWENYPLGKMTIRKIGAVLEKVGISKNYRWEKKCIGKPELGKASSYPATGSNSFSAM